MVALSKRRKSLCFEYASSLAEKRDHVSFSGALLSLTWISQPLTASVEALNASGCPRAVCFGLFHQKMVLCGFSFVFCKFVINHCVCRNQTTLQIGNTHEHTVWRRICCLSRGSGVIVVVSGPSVVSMVLRLVRSWLLCSSGFWLCLFVARFCLAEVI